MQKVQRVLGCLLAISLVGICCFISERVQDTEHNSDVPTIQEIEEVQKHTELTIQNLYRELCTKGVKYPEIVLSQAILETGWFSSNLCNQSNNLFGLYNSRTKSYFAFDNWQDSIDGYLNSVQYKFSVDKYDCYYDFLNDIGYAEDPLYTKKLQKLVSKLEL